MAQPGRKVNDDERFTQRAWYFTHIFADPKNTDTVYVLNTGAFRSTDGGKTFDLLPAPHGDHHGLWIDPTDPERMINGNDGGATITLDGGKTWSTPAEPADRAVLPRRGGQSLSLLRLRRAAGQQHRRHRHRGRAEGVIGRQDWYAVGGGESGYIAPDPRDANIVYAGDGGGVVTRYDHSKEIDAGHFADSPGYLGTRCSNSEGSLPVDGADHHFTERSQHDLYGR